MAKLRREGKGSLKVTEKTKQILPNNNDNVVPSRLVVFLKWMLEIAQGVWNGWCRLSRRTGEIVFLKETAARSEVTTNPKLSRRSSDRKRQKKRSKEEEHRPSTPKEERSLNIQSHWLTPTRQRHPNSPHVKQNLSRTRTITVLLRLFKAQKQNKRRFSVW